MKKKYKNNFLQKVFVILPIIVILNFIVPTYSNATVGGALVSPLVDLVCSIGDVVINLLERCMTGQWGAGVNNASSFNIFMVYSEDYFNDINVYQKKYLNSNNRS